MIIDINELNQPGVTPHTQVSGDNVTQADIAEFPNKSGARIVTRDSAGKIVDDVTQKAGDVVVIILPAGNWQWETSADGVKYRKLWVMQSVAPNYWRINLIFNGLFAPANWSRWTKV